MHHIAHHGKEWLVAQQEKERKRTGIATLKINYNRVFGYYIEVTKIHLEKVPADYIRKQTLVNAERYITPELKEIEEKILGAEEKMNQLEYELFQQIREKIALQTGKIQQNAALIARLDCLCSFARISIDNHYVRPKLREGKNLRIRRGRHPVVEKFPRLFRHLPRQPRHILS